MHLLIPYIHLNPPDPLFDEFTYGDRGARGKKLKSQVNKGDYIFFHTSRNGKRYITAYYVVDRVLYVSEAAEDDNICLKYKNHHIHDYLRKKAPATGDDVIVFGDPITSYILERPLLFDKNLVNKLSLKINFLPNLTQNQSIASATRAWRELTDEDVEQLKESIKELIASKAPPNILRSTEEVAETLEKDIEDIIAVNPDKIGTGLKLSARQLPIASGRIDLLFENAQGHLVVVEVKLHKIGREALRQVQRYVKELKQKNKNVKGVLVCSGVMPAYENELRKQNDIKILTYGWELKIQKW
ncbi:MAG: DUF91 domain-containing protein [Chloroflexi bacterium]|nr:MAG: DUF91 domain-containing protein [Chloroflexota bacterium]